jgi:WD40 repeat protein
VQTLAFTADGRRLATAGGDWKVMYWELPEPGDAAAKPPKADAEWGPFAGMPMSLSFSPDGTRLLIGHNYCDTWDVTAGKPIRRLPGTYAAYSPDGQTVATGGVELANTARIWDAETGRERAQMVGGHQHGVTALIFSPNGRRVITGSASKTGISGQWEASIRCWDANTGEEVFDFGGCCD